MAERQDSDREVLTSLPRSRPVRRSAKRGERAATKTGATTAAPRRTAAPKPRVAKAAAAGAKPKAPSKTASKTAQRPQAAPGRKVPPAGYAVPTARSDDAGGSGAADILSTTIQAAAELAQIGLTVGRQTLQSMLDRLPKP